MGDGAYRVVGVWVVAILVAVHLHVGFARERLGDIRRWVGIVLFCHWGRAGGMVDERRVFFSFRHDGVGALGLVEGHD